MIKKLLTISILTAAAAFAHCDSFDGPVIQAARQALTSGNVNPVLSWVHPNQEATIRAAFLQALSVRKLTPGAEKLADTWFFETLVRIHRAGEGAPYTGLKSSGSEITPSVRSADGAIATGELESLQKMLAHRVDQGLRERFSRVLELRKHAGEDVAAGRRYVAAYVDFIHFVERVEQAVTPSGKHGAEHAH